jgi:hypothetical protein
VNYEILQSKNRKNCMCTAMMFDPLKMGNEAEETDGEVLLVVE